MYDWFWVLTRLTYTCWLPHVLRRKRYGDCFTLLCFPDNNIRWVIYQILRILKAMVFPVVMCRCESWTMKKAECWTIHAFVLWCWRRLLRVPWIARRSNQSILKEINPEYSISLEGLMVKLKLQYFGHLMWRANSLAESLMLGKTEGRKRRGRQDEMVGRHHRLGHELEQPLGDGEGQGSLVCCRPWGCKESDTT